MSLTMSHGQRREAQSRTSTTLFWPRTREEFYQRRAAALERVREWVLLRVAAPIGGLAEGGCVPARPGGPPSGRRDHTW